MKGGDLNRYMTQVRIAYGEKVNKLIYYQENDQLKVSCFNLYWFG